MLFNKIAYQIVYTRNIKFSSEILGKTEICESEFYFPEVLQESSYFPGEAASFIGSK